MQPACKAARVSRTTAYKERDNDPEFKAAWEDALKGAAEDFEASCFEWARRGIRAPIVYQGVITAIKLERSQFLAALFLRALNPDKYAEPKLNIGANASPVDIAALVREAISAMKASVPPPPPPPAAAQESPSTNEGTSP